MAASVRKLGFVRVKQQGGVLLMTMVFLGMFMIMMIAGVGLLNTQFHQTTDQEQEEKAFEVADAGVHHALWLLRDANVNPDSLNGQTVARQVLDPATGLPSGAYYLLFVVQTDNSGLHTVTVYANGQDAAGKKWQTITATVSEYDAGGGTTSYYLSSWDHKP